MLSRLVMPLLFAIAMLVPRYAAAALAVPMCSAHGECMVAPPPEAPPTGGEIRRVGYDDPLAPGIDLAPNRDPQPLPWQVPSPDPALVAVPSFVLIAPSIAMSHPPITETQSGPFGVRTEVFRPPCVD